MLNSNSEKAKQEYLSVKLDKAIKITIVFLISSLIFLYFSILAYTVFKAVVKKQNNQQISKLYGVVSIFRTFVSKLLFLPIFHILSFSISCSITPETEKVDWACSYDKDLPCIFSGHKGEGNFIQRFYVWIGFICLIFHVFIGLLSEWLDFDVRIFDASNCPK